MTLKIKKHRPIQNYPAGPIYGYADGKEISISRASDLDLAKAIVGGNIAAARKFIRRYPVRKISFKDFSRKAWSDSQRLLK